MRHRDPSQFWLTRDYLPEVAALRACRVLSSLTELAGAIGARMEPVPIPWDCADGFFEAYWRRPEAYMNENVRRGISVWATVGSDVEQRAVHSLSNDLASGRWAERTRDPSISMQRSLAFACWSVELRLHVQLHPTRPVRIAVPSAKSPRSSVYRNIMGLPASLRNALARSERSQRLLAIDTEALSHRPLSPAEVAFRALRGRAHPEDPIRTNLGRFFGCYFSYPMSDERVMTIRPGTLGLK